MASSIKNKKSDEQVKNNCENNDSFLNVLVENSNKEALG